jgi:hypothetical protein
LLAVHFAADSTHMEGLTKTAHNITWITNRIVQLNSFDVRNGAAITCNNIFGDNECKWESLHNWYLLFTQLKNLIDGDFYLNSNGKVVARYEKIWNNT